MIIKGHRASMRQWQHRFWRTTSLEVAFGPVSENLSDRVTRLHHEIQILKTEKGMLSL
jgi:hypothetical protein